MRAHLDMRSVLLGILCVISQSNVGGFMFLPLFRLSLPLDQPMKTIQTCNCGMGRRSFSFPARTHARINFLSSLRAQSASTESENLPEFAEMAAIAGANWEGVLVKFGANGE
jgi:hypothetical protein